MSDKISIIIPVYNTEQYLEKCLQSVLQQAYDNIEVICINDGSTDNSGIILDEFTKKDKRVRVIHKGNEGVAIARNEGLKIATGDWIGFVDSDDYISQEMYEFMLKRNERGNADIVSCGYYIDYGDKCIERVNKKKLPETEIRTRDFLQYIYERDNYQGVASYSWTRLFSRKLFYSEKNELRLKFDKDIKIGEDILFVAQALMISKKYLHIDRPMYYYVQRVDSILHNEKKNLEEMYCIELYKRIMELYRKCHISEEIINLVIRLHVYQCGKLMELTIKYKEQGKYLEVKNEIMKYKEIYISTNKDYPERVQWLENLMAAR